MISADWKVANNPKFTIPQPEVRNKTNFRNVSTKTTIRQPPGFDILAKQLCIPDSVLRLLRKKIELYFTGMKYLTGKKLFLPIRNS
jgi:hypothetical protein